MVDVMGPQKDASLHRLDRLLVQNLDQPRLDYLEQIITPETPFLTVSGFLKTRLRTVPCSHTQDH
jgi:hypothetical protein